MRVLLERSIPSCFTCMNPGELQADAAALSRAGAAILHQDRNTFSSLVPLRDLEAAPDEFYYLNGWVICFKGRQAGAGGGGSS